LFGKNKVAYKLTYKPVHVWMDHKVTYKLAYKLAFLFHQASLRDSAQIVTPFVPEEAGAAIAAESSTDTWITVIPCLPTTQTIPTSGQNFFEYVLVKS